MAKKSPGKILKSKGLIPKDWNLRQLSTGQKSWITKLARQYSEVVKKPQDFAVRKVAPKTAKAMKSAGYGAANGRVIVHAKGAKVNIRGNRLRFENASRIETTKFTYGQDTLKQLHDLEKKKLKRGQAWTAKIGDKPVWSVFHGDLRQLLYYIRNNQFNAPGALEHISIVLVEAKSGRIIEQTPYMSAPDEEDEDHDEEEDEE